MRDDGDLSTVCLKVWMAGAEHLIQADELCLQTGCYLKRTTPDIHSQQWGGGGGGEHTEQPQGFLDFFFFLSPPDFNFLSEASFLVQTTQNIVLQHNMKQKLGSKLA